MANIFKRNKNYYFRCSIPDELQIYFDNRKEYIKSLKTKNVNIARYISRYLVAKINLIKLEFKMLTLNEINTVIEEFKNLKFDDIVNRNSYLNIEQINNLIKDINQSSFFSELVHKEMEEIYDILLTKNEDFIYGIPEDIGKNLENKIKQIKINALNEVKNKITNNIIVSQDKNLISTNQQIKKSIQEVIEEFLNQRDNGVEQREKTIKRILNNFSEYCMNNNLHYIQDITRNNLNAYKKHLQDTSRGLKVSTLNGYMAIISMFINFCNEEAEYTNISTKKLSFKKSIEEIISKKEPFSKDDIKLIFTNINLLRLTTKQKESKYYDEYEIALKIALYSGARLNEILQLTKQDIIKIDDKYCFSFNIDEGKSIKNINSIRKVPIHKNILEDVHNYSKNKEGNLFTLNRDKLSKDFGVFKNELGMSQKKSFHSFRRTFQNELKQQGISFNIIQELSGHSVNENDKMTYIYTEAYNINILNDAVNKLYFDLA